MVTLNMQIEVSAVKGALDQIKRKIPSASRKSIGASSAFIENAILKRTEAGRDYKGRAFKKYSKGYARKRAKEGRTLTPNLYFEGLMLGNMTFKIISSTKGIIHFPNTDQNKKAFWHNISGAGKGKVVREFFNVNKKEEDKAVEVFRKSFEKELRI